MLFKITTLQSEALEKIWDKIIFNFLLGHLQPNVYRYNLTREVLRNRKKPAKVFRHSLPKDLAGNSA